MGINSVLPVCAFFDSQNVTVVIDLYFMIDQGPQFQLKIFFTVLLKIYAYK